MSAKKRPHCAAVITFDGEGGAPCTFHCQLPTKHRLPHSFLSNLADPEGRGAGIPYQVTWRGSKSWYRGEEA